MKVSASIRCLGPRAIAALLGAALLLPDAAPAAQTRLPSDTRARVDSLLVATIAEIRIPGLSIAIVLDGDLAWADGYGFADLENHVPATPRTAYRSASIGKTMTAVAVMQLAESGDIDLDAPVQRYCPAYPEKRWPVTARRLLSHLGGVRHYLDETAEEEVYNTQHYESVAASLESFAHDSLLHEPGTLYLYTSHGYTLLGCVLEGATGEPFMSYLSDEVFRPAGMTHTRDDDPNAIIANRAEGYRLDAHGELLNARAVDMSNRLPAGGYITTVEDLARFVAALMNGELLAHSTLDSMLMPQRTVSGETVPYGLGWGLFPGEDWYGEKEAFHGGMTPGVSGMLYMLPARRFAVALLMNLEGVSGRTQLAADIARIVLELDAAGVER